MSSEDLSSCLDRGELLKAIRNLTGRTDVVIEDGVEVSRATKGIEGFLSLVLRVRVPYRCGGGVTQETTLILKCMPRIKAQHGIVQMTRVFPREGTFFHEVYPILSKVSGGKIVLPMPKEYHSKYGGEDDVIFMEDLAADGYQTPARIYLANGLDFDHCRLVMDAYGKFHALTIAGEKHLPSGKANWSDAFPELSRDPMVFSPGPNDPPLPFMGMLEMAAQTFLDIAKGLDGLPKEAEASGKLKDVVGNTWNLMRKMFKPKVGEPRILTHGDCWMKNSMFRYEKVGEKMKPVEIKFVDFQMVRHCHPCLDLVNFLYSSTRKNFRAKYLDSLVGIYYESLARSLEAMNFGSPPYNLEKLLSDMHGVFEGYGLILESLFLPMTLLGEEFVPSNAEDFTAEKYDEFITTGNFFSVRSRYASDPIYRSMLDEIIRDVVGYIFPNGVDSPISPFFSLDCE